MLNGLGQFQRIILLGGKSDLALSILEHLPISEDAEIFLCGRNLLDKPITASLSGYQTYTISVDFTDLMSSKEELTRIFKSGDIDLVIVAYAILGNESKQLDSGLFENVLNTNFYSQAILLNDVYAKMAIQMHGQILLISSVAGIRPRRRNFVYGVSKFGVDFIAQGLQKMSRGQNVFITILRPGFVHTKMTAGLSAAPFATEKEIVAKIASKAILRKKPIAYAPRVLGSVMFVLKLLPERVFRILDK
jgi:decaprenylphospho-beta-D-erythro-pentofuranosid-2-ulose 2-reductase